MIGDASFFLEDAGSLGLGFSFLFSLDFKWKFERNELENEVELKERKFDETFILDWSGNY